MITIEGARLPIFSWAPDLEEGARKQAINCANLPVAFHHVAVMADGHQGYGVPIGAVLALDNAISPFAVGNDIGCGMGLVPTTIISHDLLSPVRTKSGTAGPIARDDIMGWVQSSVPAGMGAENRRKAPKEIDRYLNEAFDAMEEAAAASRVPLSAGQSTRPDALRPLDRAAFLDRGRSQAGTLGAGNHFIELLAGPEGEVAVLIHSGSRGVGGIICANFHRMALAFAAESGGVLSDPGLAWLPLGSQGDADRWVRTGRCYERALRAGLEYAHANRELMLAKVAEIIERRFSGAMSREATINIHHNDATCEEHFGRRVWVHRKGAVKAARGTATITPGSMGTGTIQGRGLGRPESFSSCSHGAGRVLSRGQARSTLRLSEQLAKINKAGGKIFADKKDAVLDEMPDAYKDLDQVMANQADLVEPVKKFTPLATYKGTERSRRRKGHWRPEEER